MTNQYLVIDNGCYNIKAGFGTLEAPLRQHNSLSKAKDGSVYIGNDFIGTNNHSGLIIKRPHDQGHLTSWETEKPIWDYTLDLLKLDHNKPLDPSSLGLLLTETPYQLPQLSMNTDQIVFEEYGFNNYYRCVPGSLVPWTYDVEKDNDFSLVIDCGFNATWIIPVIYQSVYWKGVKKLPIGGKVLNGLLREVISFRHYDISEEPVLINTIKESTCFVAEDFNAAIKRKQKLGCEFVLPDFKTTTTGFVKTPNMKVNDADLQSLLLTDERFVVPESLYHPEIIFDNSQTNSTVLQTAPIKNLTDLVVESVMSCPEVTQPLLLQNISVVGGTSNLANFDTRLKDELAKELPLDWKINVVNNDYDRDLINWYGGSELSQSDIIGKINISKQEYYEHGSNWCQKQFGFKNI